MIPKEKALELLRVFTYAREEHETYVAKECAKSCVDEIFNVYKKLSEDDDIMFLAEIKYWEEVKIEVEKL